MNVFEKISFFVGMEDLQSIKENPTYLKSEKLALRKLAVDAGFSGDQFDIYEERTAGETKSKLVASFKGKPYYFKVRNLTGKTTYNMYPFSNQPKKDFSKDEAGLNIGIMHVHFKNWLGFLKRELDAEIEDILLYTKKPTLISSYLTQNDTNSETEVLTPQERVTIKAGIKSFISYVETDKLVTPEKLNLLLEGQRRIEEKLNDNSWTKKDFSLMFVSIFSTVIYDIAVNPDHAKTLLAILKTCMSAFLISQGIN